MEEKKINFNAEPQKSAFDEFGIEHEVDRLKSEIKALYLSDSLPWVVGYSGGKDSTATLQIVWQSIIELPAEKRNKEIHVISTDTLVENPVVSMWVQASLEKMRIEADKQKMPIIPNKLTPRIQDRFWVNLIGKGYPAPRQGFRWCTSRLKIQPSNDFILDVVDKNAEAILLLGTRKAESISRKISIENYEGSTRELLSRNGISKLDRVWIYPPIKNWSNDDVWEFLVTYTNPWGFDNHELLHMYRGATVDNECPLVVDSSTPSCGDSRFGCFVCTLVDKDKSMEAMIKNDDEKKWMTPLAEFRNKYLDTTDDFKKRDFRRLDGRLHLMTDKDTKKPKLVHGPYLQTYRETLLEQLLLAQEKVRSSGVPGTESFNLIMDEEIAEIRRIWLQEKNEVEDSVPLIYRKVTGKDFKSGGGDELMQFNREDLGLLKNLCTDKNDNNDLHYKLVRNLLSIEKKYSRASRRVGIYENLENAIISGGFEDEEEALNFAIARAEQITEAEEYSQKIIDSSGMYEVAEDDSMGEKL